MDALQTPNGPGPVPPPTVAVFGDRPVGGPVRVAWREGTLTRAKELESLTAWLCRKHQEKDSDWAKVLTNGIRYHLDAAREAAGIGTGSERLHRLAGNGSRLERARSNLDAAEAVLLNLAPPQYLLGQMPSLLNHVQRHLNAGDPRRTDFERIARCLGVEEPCGPDDDTIALREKGVEAERGRIISVVRGASSAALREQLQVRSFRNVLVTTTVALTILAVVVAAVGWFSPTTIPLCFQPEKSGQSMVVCPTRQSALLPTSPGAGSAPSDVDGAVQRTARRADLLVVELVGLIAAAVAAAAAIGGIKGSSEPHALPVALALLKLPTGAITAFLGLLLMRGQFLPGLSALDTSAQIVAWALVFGYAQQLFTRLVDQQAHSVLNGVRASEKHETAALAATPA